MARKIIAAVLMLAFVVAAGSGQEPQTNGGKKKVVSSQPVEQWQEEISNVRNRLTQLDEKRVKQQMQLRKEYDKAIDDAGQAFKTACKAADAQFAQEMTRLTVYLEQLETALKFAKAQRELTSNIRALHATTNPNVSSAGSRSITSVAKPANIEEKLDMILKRLEPLEKKVQQVRYVNEYTTVPGGTGRITVATKPTIEAKLDMILKRLEAMEQKVERLETTNKDKPISNWGNPMR